MHIPLPIHPNHNKDNKKEYRMQGQIEFIPKNNQTYKILSAADNQKGFTLH